MPPTAHLRASRSSWLKAEADTSDAESDDEFREDESRATSPSKMTARQRAKREKELGEDEGLIDEGLMSLPDGQVKVKPILTEAERLQKREEMARRRKRQNEQRLQDEQVSYSDLRASVLHLLVYWSQASEPHIDVIESLDLSEEGRGARRVQAGILRRLKLTSRIKPSTACCVRRPAALVQS